MNENYKNWLKKIGIAGFLFFLIKGILWLFFGSAIYKWLKAMLVITTSCLIPTILIGQTPIPFLHESTFCSINKNLSFNLKPSLFLKNCQTKPFFCRLENQWNDNKKTRIKFRLGSMEYSNKLEYAKTYFVKE